MSSKLDYLRNYESQNLSKIYKNNLGNTNTDPFVARLRLSTLSTKYISNNAIRIAERLTAK